MMSKDFSKNIDHEYFMNCALHEAKKALSINEVPIGAIVVRDNKIIGRGFNSVIQDSSVLSHAELNAIADASKNINNYRLIDCDIYVTVEPCYMCCMALIHARISSLYFDTKQPNTGAAISNEKFFENSSHNHKVRYVHLNKLTETKDILIDFFKDRR